MQFRNMLFYLSNFYVAPFTDQLTGVKYESVEHYYQSEKTDVESEKKKIIAARTPGKAKWLGRKCTISSKKNWNAKKLNVMRKALLFKFSQNINLYQKLVDTRDTELIEGNTWGDTFWGECNGVGDNHLGKLLMELREDIQKFTCAINKVN